MLILFVTKCIQLVNAPSQCQTMHGFVENPKNNLLLKAWVTKIIHNKKFWAKLNQSEYIVELGPAEVDVGLDWELLGINAYQAVIEMKFKGSGNYQDYNINDAASIRLGTSRLQIIYEIDDSGNQVIYDLDRDKEIKPLDYKNIKVMCGNQITTVVGREEGSIEVIDIGD